MSIACLLEEHAREMLGMPPEWQAYRWELLPHGSEPFYYAVTGAVAPPLKSGPRKGRPNLTKADPSTRRVANIQFAVHDKWLHAWEQRTGKCKTCEGEGKLVTRVSTYAPAEYRPCPYCKATGKARGNTDA